MPARIDADGCIGCGICDLYCPPDITTMDEAKGITVGCPKQLEMAELTVVYSYLEPVMPL